MCLDGDMKPVYHRFNSFLLERGAESLVQYVNCIAGNEGGFVGSKLGRIGGWREFVVVGGGGQLTVRPSRVE